jgi:hypothetical protein
MQILTVWLIGVTLALGGLALGCSLLIRPAPARGALALPPGAGRRGRRRRPPGH